MNRSRSSALPEINKLLYAHQKPPINESAPSSALNGFPGNDVDIHKLHHFQGQEETRPSALLHVFVRRGEEELVRWRRRGGGEGWGSVRPPQTVKAKDTRLIRSPPH
ncbi:hypothetical protein NQZ68_030187 [Dissostichus eleginoides]|nr:hypothetical protein NQZ68_030187 [Dissostichus eleginoides]